VLIDRHEVSRLKSGEERSFPLEAGRHEVQLKIDWCSSPVTAVEVSPGGVITLEAAPKYPDEKPRFSSFMAGMRVVRRSTLNRREWIVLRRV
jgi:hypothetical protein